MTGSNMIHWRRAKSSIVAWLRHGITLRRAIAGMMTIIGLGRLGAWLTLSQSNALPVTTYGWLLTVGAAAQLITEQQRQHRWGRCAAALCAILLAGMAWDVGIIGVTALLEYWMAVCLAYEAVFPHD